MRSATAVEVLVMVSRMVLLEPVKFFDPTSKRSSGVAVCRTFLAYPGGRVKIHTMLTS